MLLKYEFERKVHKVKFCYKVVSLVLYFQQFTTKFTETPTFLPQLFIVISLIIKLLYS